MRSSILIVPRSPDLFEGTLYENIDPVGEHQDVNIWIALEHVRHLRFISRYGMLTLDVKRRV